MDGYPFSDCPSAIQLRGGERRHSNNPWPARGCLAGVTSGNHITGNNYAGKWIKWVGSAIDDELVFQSLTKETCEI